MLEVQRDRAWQDIVTLDGSWFYLSADYEFVSLLRDESSRKRTTHNSMTKFALTIVWNPHGFHLIVVLEKVHKFNAGDYIAEKLE
jgi:hypothetical protein